MNIKKELGKFTNDKSLLALVKTTFFTGFTKYIGVVLGFLLSVFLARHLGPENYGFFELVNKYFAIFSIFCLFGGGQVIVREVAKFDNQRQNKTFSSLTSGLLISGFLSLLCSGAFVIFSEVISNFLFGNSDMSLFIILIGVSLPFQIISRLFSSALIGINKIWVGNLANQIIVIFIVVIGVLIHYIATKDISLVAIAVYYLLARVMMLMFYLIYWFKVVSCFTFKFDIPKYLSYARPLLLASATIVLMDSLASIFLGIYHNKSEIAFFSVAYKLSSFVAIILQISNSALSPKISNFYHNSKVNELNKILRRFTRILIFIGFFVFLLFFIWGKEILKVWGPDFYCG